MSASTKTGLTLLLGPANSGKLGRVIAWWQKRLVDRPVVVTPTSPDARELTAELVARAGGLVQQAPAVTFDGLVQLLLRRSPRYATEIERELLISRVLANTPTTALSAAGRLPGAVPALQLLLQQLGESGRAPDEIDSALTRWGAADAHAAALADDLRHLAAAYEEALARLGLSDRPAAVREATAAETTSATWNRPVAFYGFTSFTPGQRELIEELAKQVEVMVTFTFDIARDVNLSTQSEIEWWRSKAAAVVPVDTDARAYESNDIAYLERWFMSDGPKAARPARVDGLGGVRFMKASGRRAEAELAAEQIAQLVRAGVGAHEIAVVVRSVPSWSRLLARVFESCAIPCYIDYRPRLAETGLGHAFLNALRGVLLDDARAVLAYLRSPYSGLSLDSVAEVELRYRRSTAKGVQVIAGFGHDIGLQDMAPLWQLGAIKGGLDSAAALGLARHMMISAAAGSAPGSSDLEEDVRAYRALLDALATLSRLSCFDGGDPKGSIDFNMAVAGFGSAAVAARQEDPTAVQVLSVQRARARRFPVVFVLGLVEGEFPGRGDRPSLLSPSQRAQLDRMGGGLFTEETDDEAAFFVSAVSRASRLLFLSTRDAEDDGSEAIPSHFFTSARDLLGRDDGESLSRTLGDQVFSASSAPTRRHYERACAAMGTRLDLTGQVCRAPLPTWDCVPEALSDPEVLADLAATKRFSPSVLETYTRCPFVWFVQRIVGAEEMETELDGRQIGQLLHSVLSSVYQQLASLGLLPLVADSLEVARSLADRAVEEQVNSAECPGSVAERRVAGWQLRRMAGNLFDMEVAGGWSLVPQDLEMWVGSRYGVDVGGFKVHGRVDRVDTTPDRRALFIIDYKSGTIPSSAAIGREEGLQLPLYLMALAAERPYSAVLGGVYLALSDKKRAGIAVEGAAELLGEGAVQGCRTLDETTLDEVLQRTRDISLQAIEGMRSGVIAPRHERSCPPWCELAPACRARQGGYRP